MVWIWEMDVGDGYGVEVVWDKWSRVVERWAWVGGRGSSWWVGGLVWGLDVRDGYMGCRVGGMRMGLWG